VNRKIIYTLLVIAVLGVLNGLIYDKEQLATRGEQVFVELRPADPRSLIQGDYMRLRYALAEDIDEATGEETPAGGRVVVSLDDRKVAEFERLYDGGELTEDEQLLGWRLREDICIGSNAYYFQEGHADLYENAEFAELRVDESGRTLLIGLRDENLRPITPDDEDQK
jgi:uncharacterized membrane-anchored protein